MASVHDKKGFYIRVSEDVEQLLQAESERQLRSPTVIATEALEAAIRAHSADTSFADLAPISAVETRAHWARVEAHLEFLTASTTLLNPATREQLEHLRAALFEAASDPKARTP